MKFRSEHNGTEFYSNEGNTKIATRSNNGMILYKYEDPSNLINRYTQPQEQTIVKPEYISEQVLNNFFK